MNYLALCQSLVQECGIAGMIGGVSAATGEMARVTAWIATSWQEIQNKHDDWGFMRSSYLTGGGASFPTIAGQSTYALGTAPGTVGVAAANFGKWDVYSFRNYTTSVAAKSDEIFLDHIEFDDWRDAYLFGALRTVRTRPVALAIAPDDSTVCVGPPSNGLYTVEGDYFTAPQTLVADVDIPSGLPAQYHMIIVYNAMKKYASYEAAPEVAIRAQDEYGPIFKQMEAKFGPQFFTGPALA